MLQNIKIKKLELFDGARNARGLTVIIDVFRAFSVACYVYGNGADRIYPVDTIEKALDLKKQYPDMILIGERHEVKYPGFDFGNSPTHVENYDFTGKSVIHTTSSGTQGIALASCADEILTGSFVNAAAIVRYIKENKPRQVSLVAMGYEGLYSTQEDSFCAQYIDNEVNGVDTDFENMVEQLRNGDGARLFDPRKQKDSPARDFDLCLALNKFDFVLRVNNKGDIPYLEKVDC